MYNISVHVGDIRSALHTTLWRKWIRDDNIKPVDNESLYPVMSSIYGHSEIVKWVPYTHAGSPKVIREPGVDIFASSQGSFIINEGYCGDYEIKAIGGDVMKTFVVNVTGN